MARLMLPLAALSLAILGLVPASRPGEAGPGIVFVTATAVGNNDGSSWDNAFTDLANAINTAPFNSEIWVAAGTYKPTSTATRSLAFVPRFGQKLFGGFAGTEETRDQRDIAANPAVLSGDIGAAGVATDNSFHVVTFDPVAPETRVLDGFTIEGGHADGAGFSPSRGGGVAVFDDAAPMLANLVIRQNAASAAGGGLLLRGPATLTNVAIRQNTAPSGAGASAEGAAGAVSFAGCTFELNVATDRGGGLVVEAGSPAINGGSFLDNSALHGAGIFIADGASATVDGTTFLRNAATSRGGGVNSEGSVAVTGATFEENTATNDGGALRVVGDQPVTITSSQFTKNAANLGGGAILSQDVAVTITDSTFIRNNVGGSSTAGLGGAITTFTGELSITGGSFVLNTAGDAGGAIFYEEGSLTITGVSFDRNSTRRDDGGAVFAQGDVKLTVVKVIESVFTGNRTLEDGGAIEVFLPAAGHRLEVTDSAFFSNSAVRDGGAIHANGILQVSGSTFGSNEAANGGAVRSTGTAIIATTAFTANRGLPGEPTLGAALMADHADLTDVSFTGNIAVSTLVPAIGSAILAVSVEANGVTFEANTGAAALTVTADAGDDPSRLANVTFSDNHGGAIEFHKQELTLNNVTLAGNDTAPHAAIARSENSNGGLSVRNSISWNNGTGAIEAIAGDTIDVSVVEGGCPAGASCAGITAADPLLKPLADKGGPTRTHGLSLGSPAIDAGDNDTCEPRDQRGADRPIDGDGDATPVCDMGAYEVGPTSIAFKASTSFVAESTEKARLQMILGAALADAATVNYRVSGGNATSGKDFVLAKGTLSFPAGVTSRAIVVTIRDDLLVEPVERIIVVLEAPTNALLGPSKHTLQIRDNERRLRCDGTAATIVGTGGADLITGTAGRDVIAGLGGADSIRALGGNDLVCAGGGDDLVKTAAGDDVAIGGRGSDELRGGGGNDELRGEAGTNRLFADRGADRLAGGAGAGDRCDGGPDADTLLPVHGCEVLVSVP